MDKVTVFEGKNGKWYWHRKSENGDIVADGGQGYADRSTAYAAAVRENMFAEIEVEEGEGTAP